MLEVRFHHRTEPWAPSRTMHLMYFTEGEYFKKFTEYNISAYPTINPVLH